MKLRQAPGSLISNWVAIPGLETLEDWCLGSCRVVCICYVLPRFLWVQPTVDGRNPAPPWMVETCWNPINSGINHLSTGAGFLPSTVVYMFPISDDYLFPYHIPGAHWISREGAIGGGRGAAAELGGNAFHSLTWDFIEIPWDFIGIWWDFIGTSWDFNKKQMEFQWDSSDM